MASRHLPIFTYRLHLAGEISRTDVRWIELGARASPLGLQRFVCRSWVAIVLIVSRLVPDYVILNFYAGRRREGDGGLIAKSKYFTRVVTRLYRNSSHNNLSANKGRSRPRDVFSARRISRRVSKLAGSDDCVVFRCVLTGLEWGICKGIHLFSAINANAYLEVWRNYPEASEHLKSSL